MVRKHYNKWEARWHENKIPMRNSFDNEQEAIKFENEKRALNKLQRKIEKKTTTTQTHRVLIFKKK